MSAAPAGGTGGRGGSFGGRSEGATGAPCPGGGGRKGGLRTISKRISSGAGARTTFSLHLNLRKPSTKGCVPPAEYKIRQKWSPETAAMPHAVPSFELGTAEEILITSPPTGPLPSGQQPRCTVLGRAAQPATLTNPTHPELSVPMSGARPVPTGWWPKPCDVVTDPIHV